mgnify:CR=1 FL=1
MEQLKAIILAAGKGTRMKSELPKVVHRIDGQCLVDYVIDAAKGAGAKDICLVVGYKHEVVEAEISHQDVQYALQTEQLGTGHAVKCASDFIGTEGDVVVLCGDTPLVTGKTLEQAIKKHVAAGNGVTVISAMLSDPFGYGRIIRDEKGLSKIVEQKDATEEEQAVREVNSGMYIFNSEALSASLDLLSNDNAAGEYYLTDTIALIKKIGLKVSALPLTGDACDEIRGVNTIDQLEEAEQIMCHRED